MLALPCAGGVAMFMVAVSHGEEERLATEIVSGCPAAVWRRLRLASCVCCACAMWGAMRIARNSCTIIGIRFAMIIRLVYVAVL